MDNEMSWLAAYLFVIPITAGVVVLMVLACLLLALLVGLIVTTVLRALNPSHPISPNEEID